MRSTSGILRYPRVGLACVAVLGFGIVALRCTSDVGVVQQSWMAWDACPTPLDSGVPQSADPIDSGLVDLNSDTIDNFIDWVGKTPSAQLARVLDRISAGNNASTVAAVNARLNTTNYPFTDLSKTLILLSIVGQLRNPNSNSALINLISQPSKVASCAADAGTENIDVSLLDCDTMIRARAVEMLGYIEKITSIRNTGGRFLGDVLTIVSTHSNVWVRRAGIDTYMFNSGDTSTAASTLASYAQSSDQIYIGRPRFFAAMDAAVFDDSVSSFYDAHPEQMPDLITQITTDAAPTNNPCDLDGGY